MITVGVEEHREVREKDYEITLGGEASPDQFMVFAMGVGESRPYILSYLECS